MESELIIEEDGTKVWVNENGDYHRDDGPAIINPSGLKVWYQNGKCHRDDGPAAIFEDGAQYWFQNAELHREDGPAAILPDGKTEWHLNDKQYSFQKWADALNLDPKTRLELLMKFPNIN